MLAAHKATTTGAHILRMKGMHAMFATNATKFLRGTIQAEEIHWTMCGRATESWWHLAGICTHPTAIHIRKEMVNAAAEPLENIDTTAEEQVRDILALEANGTPTNYLDNDGNEGSGRYTV